MNSPGATSAALRVVPAHQRLGGDDVAVLEVDDRLVLDGELAALDRLLELLLEAVARAGSPSCMLRSKRAQRPLPRSLASYMATSASRISSPARIGSGRLVAMPTLSADADRLAARGHALARARR